MTRPSICPKCGTSFSAGSIANGKCGVCGTALEARTMDNDPKPSRKGEGWLWLAALPWEWLLFGSAVIAGLTAFFSSN